MDQPEDLSKKKAESGVSALDNCSVLRSHLQAPSAVGLSLLVAAADASQQANGHKQQNAPNRLVARVPEQMMDELDNGQATGVTEPTKRRHQSQEPMEGEDKDESYWAKRRRNNEAAKKSREKRRQNDNVIESRLMQLTDENNRLKQQLVQSQSGSGGAVPLDRMVLPQLADTPTHWSGTHSVLKPEPHLPLAAAGLPFPSQHLLAPSPLLHQLYQYQPLLVPNPTGAFQSVPPSSHPSLPSAPHTQSVDHNQLLRHKLTSPVINSSRVSSTVSTGSSPLLESLLSKQSSLPLGEKSLNMCSSGAAGKSACNSLKECLSSLAVHLHSSASSGHSTGLATTDSGSGSSASMMSPSSSNQDNEHQSTSSGGSCSTSAGQPSPGDHNGNADGAEADEASAHNPKQRYRERRRRNNEAAKRCRANRRALFDFRSRRANELERDNAALRQETQRLTMELAELKRLLGAGAMQSLPPRHPLAHSGVGPATDNDSEVSSTDRTTCSPLTN